jgi:hypothetical protein
LSDDPILSRTIASIFIKQPNRQNIFEEYALKKIKAMPIIKSAKKLSASGKDAIYIVKGNLLKIHNLPERQMHKSIDFDIETINNKHIYASHKYTKDSGGSQDNQYNDMLNFVKNANESRTKEYFFAIIDGEYYNSNFVRIVPTSDQEEKTHKIYSIKPTNNNGEYKLSKKQYLNILAKNNVRVCSLNEFENIAKNL